MQMSFQFKYILVVNDNCMIKLQFQVFSFGGILIGMAISSDQKSCKIKNDTSSSRLTIITYINE